MPADALPLPDGWIEDARAGDPRLFGGVYREVLPKGAYRNQFWVEVSARAALTARGVFGQMIYLDPQAEFGVVKLSSWPKCGAFPRHARRGCRNSRRADQRPNAKGSS